MLAANGSVPPHPLGVKPLGNQYLYQGSNARRSLGRLQMIPDELLMQILELLDDADSLKRLGYTCKFLYAFCHAEELWRSLFIRTQEGSNKKPVTWLGSWRSTVLGHSKEKQEEEGLEKLVVDCGNIFSDILYRPFACSQINLRRFSSGIPRANQIQHLTNLTQDEFAERWGDRPFVLTDCVKSWAAYQEWSLERLLSKYGNVEFRAEAVDWTFSTYYDYMESNGDESPLYLFDRQFVEKMGLSVGPEQTGAYSPPGCFGPDMFSVLRDERPAHRWLIVGPRGSGSSFHKDPNATSAWNAVVRGSKYWIMFPPHSRVPGVYASVDGSEVTSPLSIAEWLLEFHQEARETPGCVEGVCGEGELLHVPSGWWHLVVNLEKGIALTQNFVPQRHLPEVLSFLRDKPDQVSGFAAAVTDPYGLFVDRLRETYPKLLDEAMGVLERRGKRREQGKGLKRKWEAVVGEVDDGGDERRSGGGFSFGFGGGDEE